jgi:hypothetical protein
MTTALRLRMQPIVEAAWIAASGAALGVIGTVIVAVTGFRNTRAITDKTIQAAAQDSIRARNDARTDRLWERKAAAYADFITHARSYRNALRAFGESTNSKPAPADMNSLAVAANNAATLVFIVLESQQTYDTCRAIIRAINASQVTLSKTSNTLSRSQATKLNSYVAQLLRDFQVAARNELDVRGIDPSVIRTRHEPPIKNPLEG